MGDISGFIVALVVAERVGFFDKFIGNGNGKKTDNGIVYDDYRFKPQCSTGYWAKRNPQTGTWSCELISGGR